MFAAALTAYDGSPDPIEDPSIGSLRLVYKKWSLNESTQKI